MCEKKQGIVFSRLRRMTRLKIKRQQKLSPLGQLFQSTHLTLKSIVLLVMTELKETNPGTTK